MKYAITFVAVFAVVAAGAALLRVSMTGDQSPAGNGAAPTHNEHADSPAGIDRAPAHDQHAGTNGDDEPAPGEVKLDLKNTRDPVSGADVSHDHSAHAHAVHHGYLIHFADKETVARFKGNPIAYLQKLELEPLPSGGVKKVDASTYQLTPKLPDECPFCGMPLDAGSNNYILHRNYKIFFG